ncbi:hypothetical protein AB4Y90_12845 [Chryseobacterium sp. 2TAF14]|uniref:hypothetical protein n=1 Tax=Chryseobacterium sp. 2TAF14 TaxID=3233007 RepID=UPI003F907B40
MKINCKNCKNEVININFTEEQKLDIYALMQNDLKKFVEHKIISDFNLDQNEVKIIIQHLNNTQGKCCECEFENLIGEYVECHNCGAFNYNITEPMFNVEFCSNLEWSLDFHNIENQGIKYYIKDFWCDGVQHLPDDISTLLYKNIKRDKEVNTKAWLGYSGQEIYDMKIKFGPESLENYKHKKSLIDCIPKHSEKLNWIKIYVEDKRIEAQLK